MDRVGFGVSLRSIRGTLSCERVEARTKRWSLVFLVMALLLLLLPRLLLCVVLLLLFVVVVAVVRKKKNASKMRLVVNEEQHGNLCCFCRFFVFFSVMPFSPAFFFFLPCRFSHVQLFFVEPSRTGANHVVSRPKLSFRDVTFCFSFVPFVFCVDCDRRDSC